MNDFIFAEEMPEIPVVLTAGPSYFGLLSLAREVSMTMLCTALGQFGKPVIENRTNPKQEVGILLEVEHAGNDELARQLEASIHQTMMLRPNVTIKVTFTEVDVMLPDVSEYLTKAVVESQKGLRNWTNHVAEVITPWW